MSLDEASDIGGAYSLALKERRDGEIALPESRLPTTKSRIILATKILIANAVRQGEMTRQLFDGIQATVGALAMFVADDQAKRINSVVREIQAGRAANVPDTAIKEYQAFAARMIDWTAWEEINRFGGEVAKLKPDDPMSQFTVSSLLGEQ
jgi:hypothetical protein